MTVFKKQLSESFDGMVTIEYMDDYIGDIEHRVLSGMLPSEDMRIVERYKEYKQYEHGLKMVDFKKLMNMLIGWIGDFLCKIVWIE